MDGEGSAAELVTRASRLLVGQTGFREECLWSSFGRDDKKGMYRLGPRQEPCRPLFQVRKSVRSDRG